MDRADLMMNRDWNIAGRLTLQYRYIVKTRMKGSGWRDISRLIRARMMVMTGYSVHTRIQEAIPDIKLDKNTARDESTILGPSCPSLGIEFHAEHTETVEEEEEDQKKSKEKKPCSFRKLRIELRSIVWKMGNRRTHRR